MKKLFSILLITTLFLSSCTKEVDITKKFYNTATVQTGLVSNTNSFVGYTDSFDNVMLGAKMGGKITKINVEIGDKVTSGQILAELDGSEAKSAYSSSSNIIETLQNLKISTKDVFEEQIKAGTQKLTQIEKSIEIANIGTNATSQGVNNTKDISSNQLNTIKTQIEQAKISFETTKLNLENQKNTLNQKENDIYTNSKNSINSAIILGNNIIDFLDVIFGVTESNKNKNDSFEIYLGAKNSTQKTQVETNLQSIMIKLDEIKKDYNNLSSKEDTQILLNKTYNLFNNDVASILKLSYQVMENSVDGTNLTTTTINTYKTNITTLQTQTQSVILTVSGNYIIGLKGSLDNIANFKKESKNAIDMLEKQVSLAEKQIEVLEKNYTQAESITKGTLTDIQAKNDVSSKQKELLLEQFKEAQIQIEAIKKQQTSKLNEIDAQIAQAQGGQNTSIVAIDNSKIISPTDGIITKKLAEIGTVIGGGTPVLSVSSNDNIKIIVGVLDDVKDKLSIGDKVNIDIDGIGEQKIGIIEKIYPSKNEITKKTNIEIKIDNSKKDIKIGSFAKVYFPEKNKENNQIIIPNTAILNKFLVPGVYVLVENKAIFKNIEIISQNDNFSQIKGLDLGEVIITDGKDNIFDGEILK